MKCNHENGEHIFFYPKPCFKTLFFYFTYKYGACSFYDLIRKVIEDSMEYLHILVHMLNREAEKRRDANVSSGGLAFLGLSERRQYVANPNQCGTSTESRHLVTQIRELWNYFSHPSSLSKKSTNTWAHEFWMPSILSSAFHQDVVLYLHCFIHQICLENLLLGNKSAKIRSLYDCLSSVEHKRSHCAEYVSYNESEGGLGCQAPKKDLTVQ